MIKQLFFTAALLVPSLAYAGTPGATLPGQIVPAGSDPIACAIGPNYNGSIPGPAQAAGFTTCAANYDFTSTGNFTFNGNTYNFSNVATWAPSNCASPPAPLFHWDFPVACSGRLAIVNDGGTNALKLTMLAGDSRSVDKLSYTIGTTYNIMAFPTTNSFVELIYRIQTSPGPYASGQPIDVWYYFRGNNGDPHDGHIETDFIEIGCCYYGFAGSGEWNGSGAGIHPNNVSSEWDGNYHKVGVLNTSDRTTGMGVCWYIDQVPMTIQQVPSNTCSYVGYPGAQQCVIDQTNGGTSCHQEGPLYIANYDLPKTPDSLPYNYSIWLQRITIWSCAGWNSNVTGDQSVVTNSCSVSPFFSTTAPSY